MSDVSAVVLTIGEASTARALDSIRRQTLPVAETVVVAGVAPFYRAMNTAVARVRTEFFIQVDADMILDPTCVADLRSLMAEGVGIVVGQVRDPLRGRIPAIKLYRRRCFDRVGFRDSICQDTDLAADVQHQGWRRIYALRRRGEQPAEWHTFAAHEPDYTPLYTFYKFVTEGARSRQRPGERRFLALFRQLRASAHPAAPIATIGIALGLFLHEEHDRLKPCVRTPELDRLEDFLGASGESREALAAPGDLIAPRLAETFRRAHALGARLRERRAPAAFRAILGTLRQGEDVASSVAIVGLCRGLFRDRHDDADAAHAFAELRALLPAEMSAGQCSPSSDTSGA